MTELSIVERPETPKSTKPFTATYSKIKNFETCPRRYHRVDVLKLYDMDTTELDKGNRLHKAMADRVMKGTPLPIDLAYMENWAKILTVVIDPQQTIQCELKLAFSRNHQGVAYFDKRVWMRVIIDYLNMVPDIDGYFVHVVDYKTGKPKDDDTQLMINAAAVFANYPLVSKIRTTFIWTEYNDTRHMIVDRDDIRELWPEITIRADALEVAHVTDMWPPKKCGLCRDYCPVTECEFNGRR